VDGEFQKIYIGPSFVRIKNGAPVKAGWCEMHDGRAYAAFKEEQKENPDATFEECGACHITKLHLNPKSWAPKLLTEMTYKDPSGKGEDIVMKQSYQASTFDKDGNANVWIETFENDFGTVKEKIVFADVGDGAKLTLPLMTPTFRRYVNMCLWTGTFVIPPTLEVVHKQGLLRGEKATEADNLLNDIEDLEMIGEDPEELYERLDELEALERGFDRTHATLNVFLPLSNWMIPDIFRVNKLPNGWKDMAIQVQVKGKLAHLRRLVEEHNGYMLVEHWVESEEKDEPWLPNNIEAHIDESSRELVMRNWAWKDVKYSVGGEGKPIEFTYTP
jgi:hypothetical protein